jgi:hypothetical protein
VSGCVGPEIDCVEKLKEKNIEVIKSHNLPCLIASSCSSVNSLRTTEVSLAARTKAEHSFSEDDHSGSYSSSAIGQDDLLRIVHQDSEKPL